MKIIGGSYHPNAQVFWADTETLSIANRRYSVDDMREIKSREETHKVLSPMSIVLGCFITFFATAFLGILGFLGGILITIAGAYSRKQFVVIDAKLIDGSQVSLLGKHREMLPFFRPADNSGFVLPKKQAE